MPFQSSADNLRDLYYEGLTPIVSLSANAQILDNPGLSIPLLRDKIVQWRFILSSGRMAKIFIKLGTCGRINHCRLILSILPSAPENQIVVASTILEGRFAKDNQWTEFVLDHPVEPGEYRCQLQSPDADDLNTVFLWLTVAKPGLVY